MMYKLHL